mmetsp:Transcript_104130/g.264428  ORF Transcript_104130/g.264428 Transcript_104130/m.264428 type:complete len:349 (+) Transcript_104130:36-1082(+)
MSLPPASASAAPPPRTRPEPSIPDGGLTRRYTGSGGDSTPSAPGASEANVAAAGGSVAVVAAAPAEAAGAAGTAAALAFQQLWGVATRRFAAAPRPAHTTALSLLAAEPSSHLAPLLSWSPSGDGGGARMGAASSQVPSAGARPSNGCFCSSPAAAGVSGPPQGWGASAAKVMSRLSLLSASLAPSASDSGSGSAPRSETLSPTLSWCSLYSSNFPGKLSNLSSTLTSSSSSFSSFFGAFHSASCAGTSSTLRTGTPSTSGTGTATRSTTNEACSGVLADSSSSSSSSAAISDTSVPMLYLPTTEALLVVSWHFGLKAPSDADSISISESTASIEDGTSTSRSAMEAA